MQSLFPIENRNVNFNSTYIFNVNSNRILYHIGYERGVFRRSEDADFTGYEFISDNGKKYFITTNKDRYPDEFDAVFFVDTKMYSKLTEDVLASCDKKLIEAKLPSSEEILDSWSNSFHYKKEIKAGDESISQFGLRPPQVGALHAIQAHWSISKKTALVVMPTGTGKTETMLCLSVAEACEGLLVIVPSDSLRMQISDKFKTLGILKDPKFGIVSSKALNPKVGFLKSGIKDIEEAKQFFKADVIVSTPQLINGMLRGNHSIRKELMNWCKYLVMDEAHHSKAKTWNFIKQEFENDQKPVLMFTATPFRNDKARLQGDVIYNYPLSLAQKDGYYKNIEFIPVLEFDFKIADEKIAELAVKALKEDRAKGYDHILMARVDTKCEAERIFNEIYQKYDDLNPIYIHSGIGVAEKKEILKDIKNAKHKIIVCVDMLGEGFDLPQLKICALHDLHKNITTSFQFFGRFTRESQLKLGHAKIVANIADSKLKGTLRALYSRDSDWDNIISQANEGIIKKVVDEERFFKNFSDIAIPNKIPLRNITPAMSSVVFRLYDDNIKWHPEKYLDFFTDKNTETISVEHTEKDLQVIIVKRTNTVKWGKIEDLLTCDYDLYILYLNREQKLLYINSSNNGTTHDRLAEAIVGENKDLFSEAEIYKCLDGIFQLELFNLGLKSVIDGPISFTMYAGNGIVDGLDELDKKSKSSSNLFGVGYENGERISIGCSSKGRIWTKLVKSIPDFCSWCDFVGNKLLDPNINTEDIFKFIQKPVQMLELPKEKSPVSIKWNEELYYRPMLVTTKDTPICDFRIELSDHDEKSIRFKIVIQDNESLYELQLINDAKSRGYKYTLISGIPIRVKFKSEECDLVSVFYNFPPIVWFHDNSKLYNNIYFSFKGNIELFDDNKIISRSWEGINIKKESQKQEKRSDSIQFNMIKDLKSNKEYKIIFDDDDAGEASDIIAIKYFEKEESQIIFELYHCKFSSKEKSGFRLKDLYEVCGQAQRSYHWKHNVVELINHMIRRNQSRLDKRRNSRFETGGDEEIFKLLNMVTSGYYDISFLIYVVQPGISKSEIIKKPDNLKLLGATDLLLKKTGNEFYVITDH